MWPPGSRARRLTDIDSQVSGSAVKLRHAAVDSKQVSGIAAEGPVGLLQCNALCYGGGLELNKVATVGAFKVTYSVHTQPGTDPGGQVKTNQDSWAIMERPAGQDILLMGVFDGHGAEGAPVSNCIAQKLPRILDKSALMKPATVDSALSSAFPEANRAMRRNPSIDCDLSGSTGVVTMLVAATGKLVVANLGDSRAVIGRMDARSAGVAAVPMTRDHTPEEVGESERVLACGGRIATFMHGNEPLGPPRVWLKEVNVPGLCMTRSFGDNVASTVGVIDRPEIMQATLKAGVDKYLVVMSDGVFEFMENQEVIDMVHQLALRGQSANEIAKRLVQEARRRWLQEEDGIVDDCTAIVAFLGPAETPLPSVRVSDSCASIKSHSGSGSSAASHSLPGSSPGLSSSGSGHVGSLIHQMEGCWKLEQQQAGQRGQQQQQQQQQQHSSSTGAGLCGLTHVASPPLCTSLSGSPRNVVRSGVGGFLVPQAVSLSPQSTATAPAGVPRPGGGAGSLNACPSPASLRASGSRSGSSGGGASSVNGSLSTRSMPLGDAGRRLPAAHPRSSHS